MTIEDTLAELERVTTYFRDIILTTNFARISSDEVGWSNYRPGIYRNLYAREYEYLVRHRQYSFLLMNRLGFLQFYYKFRDNNNYGKIKMAYYPYPILLREDEDDVERYLDEVDDVFIGEYFFDLWSLLSYKFGLRRDIDISEELLATLRDRFGQLLDAEELIEQDFEQKYKLTNSSHVRIDYDSEVSSHHSCEIQIGAVNNIRLPMDKIISPFMFFDFVVKNVHGTDYIDISQRDGFRNSFATSKDLSSLIDGFSEDNIFITLDLGE